MMTRWLARARSLWRGIRHRSEIESEMTEEFRVHMELRTEDLMRSGLSARAALRRARSEFGSTERYKEDGRAVRGLVRIDLLRFSWLDFKLGFRMLMRYPGLTVVGGLAMAFAIWIGAGSFQLIKQWVSPSLGLEDADRLVGIQLWNTSTTDVEARSLHDFVGWRDELRTIQELGAFRVYARNLTVDEGAGVPVEVAEITSVGLGLARVPARLGRALQESDDRIGGPPVIVLSHGVWQRQLGGDPDVIGRAVRLGNAVYTVIGVMPESFGYPISQDVWVPFRENVLDYPRGSGPAIRMVGRLAPGATMADAQAELTALGVRASREFPETHANLRPQVLSYAAAVLPVPQSDVIGLRWVNLFVLMLITLVCANVALLIFARAATRQSEIIVRNALGASRMRIVTQLFAEALVLGILGAMIGLAAAGYGVRLGMQMIESNVGRLPFWFDDGLSGATLLYTLLLVVFAAMVAGILPALRMTRDLGERIRQTTAGAGGLKFGGVWTFVIVAQVAVTVVFPMTAFLMNRTRGPIEAFDVGFSSEEYLSVELAFDGTAAEFRRAIEEFERRLSSDGEVIDVTLADRVPRAFHMSEQIADVDDFELPSDSLIDRVVNVATVDVDYHEVLGAPVLAGRPFNAADRASGQRVIIVNQSFVTNVLQGHNPIGRRIRFMVPSPDGVSAPEPGEAHEIIGVVRDLGMNYLGQSGGNGAAGFYRLLPAIPPELYMVLHVRGEPAAYGPRVLEIARAVDPRIRLNELQPMDQLDAGVLRMIATFVRIAMLVSTIALVLSLAAIYAVMSFAVSRRTREIGIRVAMGADARGIIMAAFRRPLAQVGTGVVAGGFLVYALTGFVSETLTPREASTIVAYTTLMFGVCLLACVVPARRALAIEPTDALRDDG